MQGLGGLSSCTLQGFQIGGLASCTLQGFQNFSNVPVLQNIDNSECFGVKFVKIYPEMTSQ
jgi:hypothetical protein